MSVTDTYINGFYENDYSDKPLPKGYTELKVQAFEMRQEVQRLINGKYTIKTGFKGKIASSNRVYVIYYKK